MEENLYNLIDTAEKLGLDKLSAKDAKEYVYYKEYFLAIDTVLVQLYEYDIPINIYFLDLAYSLLKEIGFDKSEYSFLESLCKE